MTYAPLLLGLYIFTHALVCHILCWRLVRPRRDLLTLFILFAIVPVANGAVVFVFMILFYKILSFALICLFTIILLLFLRPAKDLLLFFGLYGLLCMPTIFVYPSIFYFTQNDSLIGSYGFWGELFAALICYSALSAAYIMTYPALQARCPSLRIVLLIDKAAKADKSGDGGLGLPELESGFDAADLVTDRLDELIASGLVSGCDGAEAGSASGAYRATWRGNLLLKPFMLFRRLLGLAPGTG